MPGVLWPYPVIVAQQACCAATVFSTVQGNDCPDITAIVQVGVVSRNKITCLMSKYEHGLSRLEMWSTFFLASHLESLPCQVLPVSNSLWSSKVACQHGEQLCVV